MAKKYNEKEVADWSVNDMLSYLSDQHLARFNVDYQPFGTWASERGQLGNWVGTKRKAGKYGAEFTKRFIDVCLAEYRPNKAKGYLGVSFGFMAAHMKRHIQTVQLEMMRAEAEETQNDSEEELNDWW
jgi:hypothetical protein